MNTRKKHWQRIMIEYEDLPRTEKKDYRERKIYFVGPNPENLFDPNSLERTCLEERDGQTFFVTNDERIASSLKVGGLREDEIIVEDIMSLECEDDSLILVENPAGLNIGDEFPNYADKLFEMLKSIGNNSRRISIGLLNVPYEKQLTNSMVARLGRDLNYNTVQIIGNEFSLFCSKYF